MSDIRFPWSKPILFGKEETYVVDALRSTWISGGVYVERLERELAAALDAGFVVSVSNGTTALELALRALDIGPGDEVIVPGFTFVAAANMVLAVGAKPILADIDPETWLLQPEEIDRLAGPNTRAVIPVHLYGNVANMEEICARAKKHCLTVVEDTAEALFSRFNSQCAGLFGSIGTFSMHATKTITTGEGGFVVTQDEKLALKMRKLRDHGMRKDQKYWHDVVGYNFRLTNLQAAIGCAQLEEKDRIIESRKSIHKHYMRSLKDVPYLKLQKFEPNIDPVLWAMTVQLSFNRTPDELRELRDLVMKKLLADGIETRPAFYALTMMEPYRGPTLPNAFHTSASVLSLPTYVGMTEQNIAWICERLEHHLQRER